MTHNVHTHTHTHIHTRCGARWQHLIEIKRYQPFKRAIIGKMGNFIGRFCGKVILAFGYLGACPCYCCYCCHFCCCRCWPFMCVYIARLWLMPMHFGFKCSFSCAYHLFVCFRLLICPYLTHYKWYAIRVYFDGAWMKGDTERKRPKDWTGYRKLDS